MASDPTQTQPQTRRPESPAAQEWYVVTGASSALRMTPGLTVGESDSGALTLNDPDAANQWVEFVLADNGEPWATITIRDKSLRVAGSTCLRHPLRVGTTLQLPNNTLHISRDIRMPSLSGTVIEVVHREIPGRPQVMVGPELEQALTTVRDSHPDMAELPERYDPAEPAPDTAEAVTTPNRDEPDDWSDDPVTVAEPRRPQAAARRRQVAVMAGALALGAVTLAGVLAMLVSMSMSGRETAGISDFDPVAVQTPPAGSPAQTPAPAESSSDASPLDAEPVPTPADVADGGSGGQAPSVAPSEPSQAAPADTVADAEPVGPAGRTPSAAPETADSGAPPAADAIPPSEPAADAVPPSEPDAATDETPEQVAMLPRAEPEPLAPITPPSVERRSLPPAPQSDSTAETAADPEAGDGQPDTTVAAEPENVPATPREPVPQSVRDGLVNQAMAQLAGGALDDARSSLQAAADAGVNPQLIADLRGEVDYRQRLINAEAGRFERLYPIDQLVAVSQEPPSVPRYASTGDEVTVEAQFTVTASGEVDDVLVLDDPPSSLERAVRRAVREWRFEPVLYNGRPLPVRSSVRFTFRN